MPVELLELEPDRPPPELLVFQITGGAPRVQACHFRQDLRAFSDRLESRRPVLPPLSPSKGCPQGSEWPVLRMDVGVEVQLVLAHFRFPFLDLRQRASPHLAFDDCQFFPTETFREKVGTGGLEQVGIVPG